VILVVPITLSTRKLGPPAEEARSSVQECYPAFADAIPAPSELEQAIRSARLRPAALLANPIAVLSDSSIGLAPGSNGKWEGDPTNGTGSGDGGTPRPEDSAGNIYGTILVGGDTKSGTVFDIKP
jgi:hypothetical protein